MLTLYCCRGIAECADDADCDLGQECYKGHCVDKGVVQVTLSWTGNSNLQLALKEPPYPYPAPNNLCITTSGKSDCPSKAVMGT